MNTEQIRNLDLNPDYFGCNSAVKRVLDNKYPDFDIEMSSAADIESIGSDMSISIKVSNFRVAGRKITPDKITINDVPIEGSVFTEVISQTKQYDVEVSYKGKTTIKTRTYFIVRAVQVLFANPNTGQLPSLPGTNVDIISDGVKRVHVNNQVGSSYMWIAVPRNNVKLLSVLPVGLVEELNMELVGYDGVYDFWKSVDKLNTGEWEFLLKVETIVLNNYKTLTTKPVDSEDLSSREILTTSDGLILKCLG